jgi:hypothetical protein
MIKPYLATREGRYLGLPLGFGFLGASYALSSIAHASATYPGNELYWLQLLTRPFAFAFLTFTYYFSNKTSNKRHLWDISLSVIIVVLASLFILFFVAPQIAMSNYRVLAIFVRAFNLACLIYITVNTLRRNLENTNSRTILTPMAFFLLAVSQYSLLTWAIEGQGSDFAFYGGIVIRFMGLITLVYVAVRSFFIKQEECP